MAFFFEGEFSLFVVVFVLSSTPVFTTLLLEMLVSCFRTGVVVGIMGCVWKAIHAGRPAGDKKWGDSDRISYLSLILRHVDLLCGCLSESDCVGERFAVNKNGQSSYMWS